MSRPDTTSLDPGAFEKGTIAAQVAVDGTRTVEERPVGILLQMLVEQLKEPDRTAVQLVTMEGMSLYQAAEIMEAQLGYLADSKTIWRWARRGEKTLRTKMIESGLYEEDESDG